MKKTSRIFKIINNQVEELVYFQINTLQSLMSIYNLFIFISIIEVKLNDSSLDLSIPQEIIADKNINDEINRE